MARAPTVEQLFQCVRDVARENGLDDTEATTVAGMVCSLNYMRAWQRQCAYLPLCLRKRLGCGEQTEFAEGVGGCSERPDQFHLPTKLKSLAQLARCVRFLDSIFDKDRDSVRNHMLDPARMFQWVQIVSWEGGGELLEEVRKTSNGGEWRRAWAREGMTEPALGTKEESKARESDERVDLAEGQAVKKRRWETRGVQCMDLFLCSAMVPSMTAVFGKPSSGCEMEILRSARFLYYRSNDAENCWRVLYCVVEGGGISSVRIRRGDPALFRSKQGTHVVAFSLGVDRPGELVVTVPEDQSAVSHTVQLLRVIGKTSGRLRRVVLCPDLLPHWRKEGRGDATAVVLCAPREKRRFSLKRDVARAVRDCRAAFPGAETIAFRKRGCRSAPKHEDATTRAIETPGVGCFCTARALYPLDEDEERGTELMGPLPKDMLLPECREDKRSISELCRFIFARETGGEELRHLAVNEHFAAIPNVIGKAERGGRIPGVGYFPSLRHFSVLCAAEVDATALLSFLQFHAPNVRHLTLKRAGFSLAKELLGEMEKGAAHAVVSLSLREVYMGEWGWEDAVEALAGVLLRRKLLRLSVGIEGEEGRKAREKIMKDERFLAIPFFKISDTWTCYARQRREGATVLEVETNRGERSRGWDMSDAVPPVLFPEEEGGFH